MGTVTGVEILLGKEDDDCISGGMRRLGLTEFFSVEYMTVVAVYVFWREEEDLGFFTLFSYYRTQ